MDTDRLNRWLTLGANLGVLIGIIFLAIEVRQNNGELNLQSYQPWAAANMELSMAALDPFKSELFAPGARQWWEAGGKTQFTPQFVDLIESTESIMLAFRWEEEKGFAPAKIERPEQ